MLHESETPINGDCMKLASGLSWSSRGSATGCASTAPRGANLPGSASAPRPAPRRRPSFLRAQPAPGAACACASSPLPSPSRFPGGAPAAPPLRLRPATLRSPPRAELQVRTAAAGAACPRGEPPGRAVGPAVAGDAEHRTPVRGRGPCRKLSAPSRGPAVWPRGSLLEPDWLESQP